MTSESSAPKQGSIPLQPSPQSPDSLWRDPRVTWLSLPQVLDSRLRENGRCRDAEGLVHRNQVSGRNLVSSRLRGADRSALPGFERQVALKENHL